MIRTDGHSLDIASLYHSVFKGDFLYADKDSLNKVAENQEIYTGLRSIFAPLNDNCSTIKN
jgi:hypothetical protein